MQDQFGARMAAAAAGVGLSAILVGYCLMIGLAHAFFGDGQALNGYELGQFLGLAEADSDTPRGIYLEALDWLPPGLRRLTAILLHVELWIGALLMIPVLVLVASLAFDWAVDGRPDPRRKDSYL